MSDPNDFPKPTVPKSFANEAAFSQWLRKKLKKFYPDTLVVNVTGTGYGMHGVHDLLLCHHGVFLSAELKMPGKKLTALQEGFTDKVTKASGLALAPLYPTQEHVDGLFYFLDEIHRGFERRKLMQSLTEDEVADVVRRAKEEIAKEANDE